MIPVTSFGRQVGELLALGALGDDGADPRVRTSRGQGLLTAH